MLCGPGGWGDLRSDQADERHVLALVGDGTARYLVLCRDRGSMSEYMLLGAFLAKLWGADGELPVPRGRRPVPAEA